MNMETKGSLRRTLEGWVCECPETETGEGATPEAAYFDWMFKLYNPSVPDDDAYDMTSRFDGRESLY